MVSCILPDSYRVLDSCANCKHCQIEKPCDDPYDYICTYDAPPEPHRIDIDEWKMKADYPLVQNKETFTEWSERSLKSEDAWDEWAQCRYTRANAVCDHWEKEEE